MIFSNPEKLEFVDGVFSGFGSQSSYQMMIKIIIDKLNVVIQKVNDIQAIDLTDQINQVQANLDSFKESVNMRFSGVDDTLNNMSNAITNNYKEFKAHEVQYQALYNRVGVISTDLTNLQSSFNSHVTAQDAKNTEFNNAITEAQSAITNLQTSIENHAGRISALEASQQLQDNQITLLQAAVDNGSGDLDALSKKLNDFESSINLQNVDIEAIKNAIKTDGTATPENSVGKQVSNMYDKFTYDGFRSMTDDEKASYVNTALSKSPYSVGQDVVAQSIANYTAIQTHEDSFKYEDFKSKSPEEQETLLDSYKQVNPNSAPANIEIISLGTYKLAHDLNSSNNQKTTQINNLIEYTGMPVTGLTDGEDSLNTRLTAAETKIDTIETNTKTDGTAPVGTIGNDVVNLKAGLGNFTTAVFNEGTDLTAPLPSAPSADTANTQLQDAKNKLGSAMVSKGILTGYTSGAYVPGISQDETKTNFWHMAEALESWTPQEEFRPWTSVLVPKSTGQSSMWIYLTIINQNGDYVSAINEPAQLKITMNGSQIPHSWSLTSRAKADYIGDITYIPSEKSQIPTHCILSQYQPPAGDLTENTEIVVSFVNAGVTYECKLLFNYSSLSTLRSPLIIIQVGASNLTTQNEVSALSLEPEHSVSFTYEI